jgi:membrane-associated phospholipid phosphatase
MVCEWSVVALDFVQRDHLSERDAARVFAALLVGQYDATIACWDAKYAYWPVRPVTVIRRDLDSHSLRFITTPSWPSYVSAHATLSPAGAAILPRFFPGSAAYFCTQAHQPAQSRLYAGVHFPIDNKVGLELGLKVGRLELSRIPGLPHLVVVSSR